MLVYFLFRLKTMSKWPAVNVIKLKVLCAYSVFLRHLPTFLRISTKWKSEMLPLRMSIFVNSVGKIKMGSKSSSYCFFPLVSVGRLSISLVFHSTINNNNNYNKETTKVEIQIYLDTHGCVEDWCRIVLGSGAFAKADNTTFSFTATTDWQTFTLRRIIS